jgi:pimeloyl-ACP methyl ester carboxylesterase
MGVAHHVRGMEYVDHDGRTTAYRYVEEGGEGPVVLYVHGSGGTHRVWSAQYTPSGPSNPATALDLSGHGESEELSTDPGSATLAAYVDDVSAVARAVDVDALVGNSLGGAVVLQSVLEGRVDPAAIVLAGTGAKLSVHDRLRAALTEDFESAVETLHAEDALFHDPPEAVVEHSIATMRAVGQSATRRDFETCHDFDVREKLDEISVPTLALCGQYDRLTPPSYHEFLADELPNGTFETIEDAAHLAMIERSGPFNDAVEAFLDAVFEGDDRR